MALLTHPTIHAGVSLGKAGDSLGKAEATNLLVDESSLCFDTAVKTTKSADLEDSKLALAVHRKTGYILAGKARHCFDGDVRRIMARQFGTQPPWEKAVHFARDPIDFAVSNFLYDKVSSTELGTLQAGSAGHYKKLCKHYFPDVGKALPNNTKTESLREYLLRIPEVDAIRTTMCQSKSILDGMVDASMWCFEHNESCIQVTLGDVMKDSESYMAIWEKITSFAGIHLGEYEKQCLQAQDTNSASFDGRSDHCTTRDVVLAEERDRLRQMIALVDVYSFGGYYAQARDVMGL